MPLTLILGNAAPVQTRRDPDADTADPAEVERTPLDGNSTTDVSLPEDPPINQREVLAAIDSLWPWHSDADGPEWVEATGESDHYDGSALERAVSNIYTDVNHTCEIGRPDGWEDEA